MENTAPPTDIKLANTSILPPLKLPTLKRDINSVLSQGQKAVADRGDAGVPAKKPKPSPTSTAASSTASSPAATRAPPSAEVKAFLKKLLARAKREIKKTAHNQKKKPFTTFGEGITSRWAKDDLDGTGAVGSLVVARP